MKGFRFYADLDTKKEQPAHLPPMKLKRLLPLDTTVKELAAHAAAGGKINCLALLHEKEHRAPDGSQEAVAAVYSWPDSDCTLTSVSFDYMRKRCRRIPEYLARKLHPRLFLYLDSD